MKLYDFHVHTAGISRCSRLTPEQLCRAIKNEGLDGFVLTNHYAAYHVTCPFEQWLTKYQKEYEYTREVAESMGLRAFFGIEVSIGEMHFLVYGLDPSVLYQSSGPLYDYSLKELSDFVHERGGLLIHAHPFRGKSQPEDAALLDGYEINCHPLYGDNCSAQIHELAEKSDRLITCGSDFHGDVYKARCGVYLPCDIVTEEQLGAYLKSVRPTLLEHEIDRMKAKEPVNFE